MLLKSISGSTADNPTSFGLGASTKFNVETMNGKAFKVLSSTLYQNKRGSIVREVASNAYDSHVAAGKADVPFEIHLPNMYEPYFSVRDFGTGLCEDDIRTVYTTLFLSTKDESNEAIGAFGLGSKSPFAYTDSFTVTSIFNGERKVYVAALDGIGQPTISLMSTNDTDESNGIEVNIGVEPDDYTIFEREVRNQLHFFKVKPIIKNCKHFEFFQMPAFFKTFGKLSILETHNTTYVIQGGVGYPLDLNQIKPKLTAEEQAFASSMVQRGCHLNFDIGEIEVTPSREGISYEYHTIKNITQVFKDAYSIFTQTLKADLDACANDVERIAYIQRGGDLVIAMVRAEKLYPHFQYSQHEALFTLNGLNKTVKVKFKKLDGTIEENDTIVHEYSVRKFDYGRRGGISSTTLSKQSIINPLHTNTVYVYNDGPVGAITRVRNRINIHGGIVYLFEANHYSSTDDADKAIKFIENAFDGITVVKLSTLDRPVRAVGAGSGNRGGYKIARCWTVTDSLMHTYTKNYDAVHEKLQDLDGGYYIVLNSDKHVVVDYNVRNLFHFMLENGMMKKDTYIIRQKDADFVKNTAGWECLTTFINNKIAAEKAKSHVIDDATIAFRFAVAGLYVNENVGALFETLSSNDPLVAKYVKYTTLKRGAENKYRNKFYEEAVLRVTGGQNAEIRKMVVSFSAKLEKIRLQMEKKYRLIFDAFPSHYHTPSDMDGFTKHAQLYVDAVNS